jgi:hypothetical protein
MCLIYLVSLVLLVACTRPETSTRSGRLEAAVTPARPIGGSGDTSGEMIVYPQEYLIYREYIGLIGGRPPIADVGVIEGTVVAIQQTDVCPFQEERCSIEPYPNDWGQVRVNRVVSYTLYVEQDTGSLEQPAQESPAGDAVGGYAGVASGIKHREYRPLQSGQQVQAHFLLSARSAKARRLPVRASEDQGSAQLGKEGGQRTAGVAVQAGEKTFRPIPREGDYRVFVTDIGDVKKARDQVLPGLAPGTRFLAEVWYDGVLYVERYEVIP